MGGGGGGGGLSVLLQFLHVVVGIVTIMVVFVVRILIGIFAFLLSWMLILPYKPTSCIRIQNKQRNVNFLMLMRVCVCGRSARNSSNSSASGTLQVTQTSMVR